MSGVACASESIQNCVLLIASPVGSGGNGGFTDPDCNVLSLTSAGVRSATGTLGDQCW
jgi:Tfp pilus assembly protein PilE